MNQLLTINRITEEALRILDNRPMFFGEYIPDQRKWPRLKAWILRKPPPMLLKPRGINIAEFKIGDTIKIARPTQYTK